MRRVQKPRLRRLLVWTAAFLWVSVHAAIVPPYPGRVVVAILPAALVLAWWGAE